MNGVGEARESESAAGLPSRFGAPSSDLPPRSMSSGAPPVTRRVSSPRLAFGLAASLSFAGLGSPANAQWAPESALPAPLPTIQPSAAGAQANAISGTAGYAPKASDYHADIRTMFNRASERVGAATEIAPINAEAFGEEIDLYSGGLSFRVTDVSIPGNSALPVEFSRRFVVRAHNQRLINDFAMGDWRIDLPRVTLTSAFNSWPHLSAAQRCSSVAQDQVVPGSILRSQPRTAAQPYLASFTVNAWNHWSGVRAEMPGGGELLVPSTTAQMPTQGGPYIWTTKENARFACLPTLSNAPGGGEGFLGLAPDGTKYWFNHMAINLAPALQVGNGLYYTYEYSLYPTRIEDRFGNSVTYRYENAPQMPVKLVEISANDGRKISITYVSNTSAIAGNNRDYISTVSDGANTWRYEYANFGSNGNGRAVSLKRVVLPDATAWAINFDAASSFNGAFLSYWIYSDPRKNPQSCENPGANRPLSFTGTVTHPSGASVSYTVAARRFGVSSVPNTCFPNTFYSPTPPGTLARHLEANVRPVQYDSLAVVSRSMSGPGVPTVTTSYGYTSTGASLLAKGAAGCRSDSCAGRRFTRVERSDGSWERHTFGNTAYYDEGLLLRTEMGEAASTARDTNHRYVLGEPRFSQGTAYSWTPGSSAVLPLSETRILQDGVSYDTFFESLDNYGRPTAVREGSNGSTRTTSLQHYDHLGRWVLGQVARTEAAGLELRTEFNDLAQPVRMYRAGVLMMSAAYHADGSLHTATDARSFTTTLSNWNRGVPQAIAYPNGTTASASVTPLGRVSWITDQRGATTSYGYDALGRVTRIDYPTGDAVAWTPTIYSLNRSGASAYGLAAGHWQLRRTEGARTRVTYLDALFRPVIEEAYDAYSINATRSFVVKRYDQQGRQIFQSHPLNALGLITDNVPGVSTRYDALGRAIQTNNAGRVTSVEFLAGGKRRTTNPRGKAVTETFRTYGQPSYDLPTRIELPEGVAIDIERSPFDAPRFIRRSGADATATREYVYNDAQQLCRQIEPETGSTFFGYDAAGNLAWSAPVGTWLIKGCGPSLPGASLRTYFEYDALNRRTLVNYPGAAVDVEFKYTPTGLLQRAAAGGNVTTYEYNRRGMPTRENYNYPGAGDYPHQWEYDALGNLSAEIAVSGLRIDYSPNALGQARSAGSFASGATYDPAGRLTGFTYGNGIARSIQYNAWGEPTRIRDVGGPGVDLGYVYDSNGNIDGITDHSGGVLTRNGFSYDDLDRLRGVSNPGGFGAASYAYDSLDNLKSTSIAGNVLTYNYEALSNRLISITNSAGGVANSFAYDNNGNITGNNTRQHLFDVANRMTEVVGVARYEYDAHGRRTVTWRQDGTAKIDAYTQDGVLRYTSDNGLAGGRTHIYLAGVPVAEQFRRWDGAATNLRYLHTDALRSVVAGTGPSREVLLSPRVYQPYGKTSQTLWDRAGYTYHMEDRYTDLVYMHQRYYDPAIGRFLSVDPVGPLSNPINHFGRYHYANNNPYRFVDPDGRFGVSPYYFNPQRYSPSGRLQQAQAVSDGAKRQALLAVDMTPILGDAKAVSEAVADPSPRTFLAAGVGFIPWGGDVLAAGIRGSKGAARPAAYSVVFEATIEATRSGSRSVHRSAANNALNSAVSSSPDLAHLLSQIGVVPTTGGRSPVGFQWHHSAERPGVMQLVPVEQHSPGSAFQYVLHPDGQGGYARWGRNW